MVRLVLRSIPHGEHVLLLVPVIPPQMVLLIGGTCSLSIGSSGFSLILSILLQYNRKNYAECVIK